MKHNRKTRPTQNARLHELLVLLGCGDEIAPFDADALAKKAVELIASVSSYQPKPLTTVDPGPFLRAGDNLSESGKAVSYVPISPRPPNLRAQR
jgi:hypothetical protein